MIKKILQKPQAVIGLILIILMLITAIFAPVIAPHNPEELNPLLKHEPLSAEYPLGNDQLGRCEFSRLVYGARYSLGISIPVLLVLGFFGLFIGSISAYYGGKADRFITLVCNIFIAFPALMIAIALIGSFGNSLQNIMTALVVSMWAWFVRMARSYCLLESKKDYVVSAKVAGANDMSIIFRHIIPNALPQFLVYVVTGVATMILTVSSFSFLGLGLPAGTAEWGAMMNDARRSMYSNPMLIVWPGIFIFITASGFTLFGEALRDILAEEDKTV